MMVRIATPLITSAIETPPGGPTNWEVFADELPPLDFRMKRRHQMEMARFGRVVAERFRTAGRVSPESTTRLLAAVR